MSFAAALLAWFERHGRSGLPWRTVRTPYRTVVSEFMLQQTQVERVVPLFERFVTRWPSFDSLAAASQADVVRAWQGLGYNSRAVRLHRLAKIVCERHGGTLPRGERELRELPGVGRYTARAIAAFAFNADAVAVDTNVRRIIHRTQLGLEWPPLAGEAALEAMALALVPQGEGYAFNSALMDLGATVCTARAPKCLLCPLLGQCAAGPVEATSLARLAVRHGRSQGAPPRPRFEETNRYARGRVVDALRAVDGAAAISLLALHGTLAGVLPNYDSGQVEAVVDELAGDGVVERIGATVRLAR
jgi:A/G-specific adenine glycosylase